MQNRVTKGVWLLLGLVVVLILGLGLWFFVFNNHAQKPPSSTTKDDSPIQNQQPTTSAKPLDVSIAAADGQTASQTIHITLNVNDLSNVSHVEYYVDGTFAGITYASPFDFNVNTAGLSAGDHSVTAKVYGKDGKSYDAPAISITVAASNASTNSSSSSRPRSTSGSTASQASQSGTSGSDSGDTTAPSAPANVLLAADDGYTANISWDASTDNVGVSGYQIYRNGSALSSVLSSSTTSYKDQTVVPGNTYSYFVKALDAAGNATPSTAPSITLVPTSVWVTADSPQSFGNDGSPLELGVKIKPLVNGTITGVRFYKASGDAASHTGTLWASNGTSLASVVFSGETASGWQTATFSTPVAVTANTTYTVSYSTPNGKYAYTTHYFDTGITSQYLTAPSTTDASGNGVFGTTLGTIPTGSFNGTNYWVDAVFVPNLGAGGPSVTLADNSVVHAGFPGSNNTGVPVGKRLPSRDRGMTIATDNTTVDSLKINGEVDIRAAGVTIKNSEVNSIVYLDRDDASAASWYVTIQDSTVNAGTVQRAVISLGQFTLRRANIIGGQSGALCSGNCQVYDSWLHGEQVPDGQSWHLGGFLSNGGANMIVSHSTISCDTPNNTSGGGCSGDLNLYGDFAPIEQVTVDGNLFTANHDAGYCVALGYNAFKTYGPGANHITFTNNTFQKGTGGQCAGFGSNTDYLVSGSPPPNSTWMNNVWDDGTVANPQ